jgi:hypothetical protein
MKYVIGGVAAPLVAFAVLVAEAGRPYGKKAFNRARRKRVQAEKYNKERNKQKRRK